MFDDGNYPSSGVEKEPYWDTGYNLAENERDTKRTEEYTVHYDNDDVSEVSYMEWMVIDVGDGYVLTKNRLGLTYSRDAIK